MKITAGTGLRYPTAMIARAAIAAIALSISPGTASAYVGESFLQVPGLTGDVLSDKYKGWVKLEAQYWTNTPHLRPITIGKKSLWFTGPQAPHEGAGKLALALDKHSPLLKPLMGRCQSGSKIADLKYAESADLARPWFEAGPRPPSIPAFFEYSLKDVSLDCPVTEESPEQLFVLNFNNIKWLNYEGDGAETKPSAAKLIPRQTRGQTKAFIVTWFVGATDVSDDQCPVLNAGPTEDEFYRLMSADEATKVKADLDSKGGVFQTPDGPLFRGPERMNVCKLPGVVRDPGHATPQSKIARGFNLDGDNGTGTPRAGVRPHKNYLSEDGRIGIDNQYFTVIGCIPGFKHKGLLTMSHAELVKSGAMSLIVEVSGIKDEQNDDSVDVTLLYSRDPMVRNSTGTEILPKYTFRVSDDPALTQYFVRVHAKIQNGVITTQPTKQITVEDGGSIRLTLYDARLRLQIQRDGSLKGIIGGYEDWREIFNIWGPSRHFEQGMNFQCPSFYNAFKRAADGLRDPVTGDYHGISAAYDIEGVPAFIPPAQQEALAQAAPSGYKER